MERFEGQQGHREFQERIDAELRHLTLSPSIMDEIRAVAPHRSESFAERLSRWLDSEIVVTLPQVGASLAIVLVAAGLYWHQLLWVDDGVLARYQRQETVMFMGLGGGMEV